MKSFVKIGVVGMFGLLILLAGFVVPASAQGKLQYKVIHGSTFNNVSSTIIYGDKDAVLIDGGLFRSDGYRIAAEMLDLKKNFTRVYITHPDADHFFGIETIKKEFPDIKIVSLPRIADAINTDRQKTLEMWYGLLGTKFNLPTTIETVERVGGDSGAELTLEGSKIIVYGNQYGDHNPSSFVWVPSLKLVCAGDIVYYGTYPWTGGSTRESRAAWMRSVDNIAKLNPAAVVPGHMDPSYDYSPASLVFMKQYLAYYETQLAQSKTGDDLVARVKKKYTFKVTDYALTFDANLVFPKR